MKKIVLFLFVVLNLYSSSVVKFICDKNNSSVYIDGKFKVNCDADDVVRVATTKGKHTLKIESINEDKSKYLYKESLDLKEGEQRFSYVYSSLKYTQMYYYIQAMDSPLKRDYQKYLQLYPNGRYSSKVKKRFESVFDRVFDIRFYRVIDLIATKDGGVILSGYKGDKKYAHITKLVKVNKDGKVVWIKEIYPNRYYCSIISMIELDNQDLILVGSFAYKYGKDNIGVVLKIDKNGNKIKETFYRKKIFMYVKKDKDGNLIVVGKSYKKGSYIPDGYVLKIDKNFNKIWEKSFGDKRDEQIFNSLAINSKGDIYIVGYDVSSTDRNIKLWLLKLDKNGDEIWRRLYHNDKYQSGGLDIVRIDDNNYMIAGYTEARNINMGRGRVLLIDKFGNIKKEYILKATEAKKILKRGDSYLVIASKNRGSYSYLEFAKISKDFNLVWDKLFKVNYYAQCIANSKDGGYWVAGIKNERDDGDVVLLKR